jgi:D-alanyl-D-alanine carboxypeptidase
VSYAPQPAYAAQPTYAAPTYAPQPSYAPPPTRAVLPPVVLGPAPRSRPVLQLASLDLASPRGGWAIQVGAFLSPTAARAAAADARRAAPDLLSRAAVDVPPTAPFGGAVLFRARLASLTPDTAARACARLSAQGSACMTVPPGR